MAADKVPSVFRGLAVAGGGESSESEDDGWEIGYLDRASQKLKGSLPTEDKNETFKKALTTGDISLVQELLSSDKQTILTTACTAPGSEEQILKCVELLLSGNADPNVACRMEMKEVLHKGTEVKS